MVVLQLALLLSLTAFIVTGSGDDLEEVQEIICAGDGSNHVTLDVREATITVDGMITYTTRAYHYNDVPMVPAPTIRMKAGEACTLTVNNDLSTTSSQATCRSHSNDFHCPDTTNLHTHGLHVSPDEDDIDVHLIPGESHDYVYNVPNNHLMGTHWYHAHHHGSTSLQVIGGMVGILLVDPADDYQLPVDLDAAYEEAASIVMILNHIHFAGNDDVTRGVDTGAPFYFWDYQGISDEYGADQTIEPSPIIHGDVSEFYAVNGQYQPVLDVVAGSVTVMRIVHGSGIRSAELYISDDPNGHCSFTLLARDGVFHQTPYQEIESIVMVQGTRSDVAVICSAESAGSTFTVTAGSSGVAVVPEVIGTENLQEQENVWQIRVSAPTPEQEAEAVVVPTSEAAFPSYLDSILDEDPALDTFDISLRNGGVNRRGFEGFEGDTDEDPYEMKLCQGEVYELTLGGSGRGTPDFRHSYHQHINHFQVSSTGADTSANGLVLRLGEWRDVIPAGPPEVRFKPVDFSGVMVLHCHLLKHEDFGMMALYNVQPDVSSCVSCSGVDCEGSQPAPEFSRPSYTFTFLGGLSIEGEIVGSVEATDPEGGGVTYTLLDFTSFYSIDSNGAVTAVKKQVKGFEYPLPIQACSDANNACTTAVVTLQVLKGNGCLEDDTCPKSGPVFQSTYSFMFVGGLKIVDKVVGTVEAIDPNGAVVVTYDIAPGSYDKFYEMQSNGDILCIKKQKKTFVYTLVVEACSVSGCTTTDVELVITNGQGCLDDGTCPGGA